MSQWDSIKKNLSNLANKTVIKTKELTDTASLKIKIASKESDRDLEYKNLGRLAYIKLGDAHNESSEELTNKISQSIKKLDVILSELEALKLEDEQRKADKQAKKSENTEAEESDEEELNSNVMDDFCEARKNADKEYQKAKEMAAEAKKEN